VSLRAEAAAPPRHALRLLSSWLPAEDREAVIGDLVEVYEDRVDARRAFNRAWFWAHAIQFAVGFAAAGGASVHAPARRQPMRQFGRSLRQASRRLRHEWRYAAAVILIFGVGIGPAAAMLSVVEKVLLRPLNYADAERVGLLRLTMGQLSMHPGLSPAEAIDMRAAKLFESLEVETRLADVSYGPPDNLISMKQLSFTTGMLPMLGVQPVIGRHFTEEDLPPPFVPPAPGTPPAPPPPPPTQRVMLDYGTWQTHFGGDRAVLGRMIRINGGPFEIIGVLPDGFRIVTGRAVPQRIDFYTPFRLFNFRNSWQFPTLAKIRKGDTFEHVQAGLDSLAANFEKQFPEFYNSGGGGRLRYTVSPVLDDLTRNTRPALRAAIGAVLLLLLIAFANAAALVVARLRTRDMDFAIRSAMGASPGALVTDALAESTVLGLGGALAGSLFAVAAVSGIRVMMPRTVPRWDEIGVGWDLVAYSTAFALAGLFLAGLLPVWRVSRGVVSNVLRAGSAQGGKAEGSRSRLILVGAQIALTVVLAFGCVQLVRSALLLRQVNLGYDANVLTLSVPYDFRAYRTNKERAALYHRIRDRVAQVPGVSSVGVITHIPLSGSVMMDGYETDLSKEPDFDPYANYQAVTPGYFATMKIPILQGRDFTDAEDANQQNVVVVDETLARAAFPGEADVIGRTLRLGWGLQNAQIVGVVGHARTVDVARVVRPQIYAPISNLFQNQGIVVVRSTGDATGLSSAITAAINEMRPGRAVTNIAMLTNNVSAATSTLMAVTGLVTFLVISAGLLSAIGLYLVIAFVVHQGRRATAIRTALGASRRQVIWRHVRTSAMVMSTAVPLGILLSLAAAPAFAGLIYGVGTRDWRSLAAAIFIAIVAGAFGTYVPVRRAADANVVKALRE
jgi:putative ABC transport system permease protein